MPPAIGSEVAEVVTATEVSLVIESEAEGNSTFYVHWLSQARV